MTEEYENMNEEEIGEMKDYFYNQIWSKIKPQLKEMSKKEACLFCFIAGSDMMRYSQEEEMKNAKEKLSKMKPEEVEEMIRGGIKEEQNELWEDKTKVNGVWIDDKTGEVLKDE
jgi:hypothetical protein